MILAIEGAIRGGSLALVSGSEVVNTWHSNAEMARSEALLGHIADLLEKSTLRPADLTKIAVSNGPGSYTGIRIALATAMGLAGSLEIPCVGVSLLKALLHSIDSQGKTVVIVPIGRDGFCWAVTERGSVPVEIGSGKLAEFAGKISAAKDLKIAAQSDAYNSLLELDAGFNRPARLVDIGRDMAVSVAISSQFSDDGLQPFYASDIALKPNPGAVIA